MKHIENRDCRTLLIALVLLFSSAPALTATMENVHFEDSVELGSTELKLNGLGIRAVLFIRGYVAGLYLKDKVTNSRDVLEAMGPKRVQLRMLRDATARDFNSAMTSGMRRNASETEFAKLNDRLAQLEKIIESVGTVREGDSISLDYLPEKGTTLAVNGAIKGQVIRGEDFYKSLLTIFVGEHPVDSRLKKGLLGQ